ncbi:MAG TPA: UPF0158 family protein [Puia sp.]|jgi:hypothetical protein|nr:UPF0158 family protein [Puia sp.]
MPVSISNDTVKEIAGYLDSGMKCFYHIPTGELEYYPDDLRGHWGMDMEIWQETIDNVANNYTEYILFEGLENYESFQMMEAFVAGIAEVKTRQQFEEAIRFKKPFQNFKFLLLDYPLLQQDWFDYKKKQYMKLVYDQLDSHNAI